MTLITEINKLIDKHDDYANCPGCEHCQKIERLSYELQTGRPASTRRYQKHNITEAQYRQAEVNGIDRKLLYNRIIKQQMDIETAMTKPRGSQVKYHVTAEQEQIAKQNGLTLAQVRERMTKGMSVERAITKPWTPRKKNIVGEKG